MSSNAQGQRRHSKLCIVSHSPTGTIDGGELVKVKVAERRHPPASVDSLLLLDIGDAQTELLKEVRLLSRQLFAHALSH